MSKTITEQIADLERENQSLKEFQKLFDKAVKLEFGIDTKKLHKIIENDAENHGNFEKKIATFFGLKTDADFAKFVEIFCTDSSLNYYNNHKAKANE